MRIAQRKSSEIRKTYLVTKEQDDLSFYEIEPEHPEELQRLHGPYGAFL